MTGYYYINKDLAHTTVCSAWDKGYRYGFNSMEKDNEINVNGGDYDFGARIYDSRLGRWLSLDQLMTDYPDLSPYNFAGNCPLLFVDIDGNKFINPYTKQVTEAKQKVADAQSVYDKFVMDNPGLKPKALKKSKEYTNLTSLQNQLEILQSNEKKVEDFLYTLKVSNETEFNYFETLKDANKEDVNIEIYVKNEQGPLKGDGYRNGNTDFNITNTDGIYTITDNLIQINIYEAASPLTNMPTTQQYHTFANELGDVKYFFEKVKDPESYELFVKTVGANDIDNYRNNQDGAGVYSDKYSSARVGDVKNTGKSVDESGNIKR
jgi:RHS repeat-associated protein